MLGIFHGTAVSSEDLLTMEALDFENYEDAGRITLRTNRYFDYFDYTMEDGAKIVLDPVEPLYVDGKEEISPSPPGIIVSCGLIKGRLKKEGPPSDVKKSFYPVDFLTINLKKGLDYSISQRGGLLIVDVGDRQLPKPVEFTPSYLIAKRLKELKEGMSAQEKKTGRGKSLQPLRPSKEEKRQERPEKIDLALSSPKTGLSAVAGSEPPAIDPMKVKIDERPPLPVKKETEKKKDVRKKDKPAEAAAKTEDKPAGAARGAARGAAAEAAREAARESARVAAAEAEPTPAPEGGDTAAGLAFRHFRDEVLSRAEKMPRMSLPGAKSTLSFSESLQTATYNSMPLMVADEEIRLSDMKVNEAKRALYPTATAKAVHTEGETSGVEFREETFGLQVEQPLYYGGRLKLALRQAQINKEAAQAKYDKAAAELIALVTERFYNLATAQLNLKDQIALISEAQAISRLAAAKYEKELSTQLELLNVKTQANQIEYQVSVAEKDLEIARINLLQAMGLDASSDISADYSLDYTERVIDLNECLLLAYQNRPELHLYELLNEAGEYELRIARAKDDFKVDFTGFYGSSGGAYKTEPLDLDDDWYVGLKMSKPLGKSTGSYSFAENQTSPKLGQTERTAGASHTLELGIMDNLSGISEKQSAYINLLKAESELVEMEKAVNLEVREAYNNYQKAIFQINNTREKIRFREEEVKILRLQSAINEALLSQVMEAKVKLGDEKALYHQAIASYKTALANLNKAIGLIDYFK